MARTRSTANKVGEDAQGGMSSAGPTSVKGRQHDDDPDHQSQSQTQDPFTNLLTPLATRYVHRLLEPGPVLLVSTGSTADGSHNLMTLGFHMMLQHSGPTLVGICLGPWDASFDTLRTQRQCVLAVPSAEMAETVVDIGNCSSTDFESDEYDEGNKWERFGLTPLAAQSVRPPLVGGPHIMGNIECVVHDRQMVGRYNLWILKAVRAWWDEERVQRTGRMLHHRGNGVFSVSGGGNGDNAVIDLHERMTKWPELA